VFRQGPRRTGIASRLLARTLGGGAHASMHQIGVVTLTVGGRRKANSTSRPNSGGDVGHGFPLRHGVQTMEMGGKGEAAGTRWDEVIADRGKDDDEPLQACRGSKALHRPLTSAQGKV